MGFLDGSGISWTACKQSAPRSRQTTTPASQNSIFTGRMLFLTPRPNRLYQSTDKKGNRASSPELFSHDLCSWDWSSVNISCSSRWWWLEISWKKIDLAQESRHIFCQLLALQTLEEKLGHLHHTINISARRHSERVRCYSSVVIKIVNVYLKKIGNRVILTASCFWRYFLVTDVVFTIDVK